MAIPDFQTVMLPLLQITADGEGHAINEAVNELAEHFSLTDEERSELLPSGQEPGFHNRVP